MILSLFAKLLLGLSALNLLFSVSAAAQQSSSQPPEMVSARDAEGVLKALIFAGYDASLSYDDDNGEPSILVDKDDFPYLIFFDDCKEAEPTFCNTLVFSAGYDRTKPITDAQIASANLNYKYISVWRDDEGDPIAQWYMLTNSSGVATPLFYESLRRFIKTAEDFSEVAWEGDTEE